MPELKNGETQEVFPLESLTNAFKKSIIDLEF